MHLGGNRVLYEQDADADSTVDTTVTYTFDANDRLTIEVLDTTGTEDDRYSVYTYDATQQVGKTVTEGTTSGGDAVSSVVNEYNLQGRMSKVTTTADGVVTETEYEYSDAGLRVKQTITIDSGTPVVTEYLFDASGGHTGYAQVVEEFIDDVLAKIYALGQDVIGEHHTAATPGGAQTLFHIHDGHGSTRMLLNDLVELVQRFAYDAYGNHLSGTGLTSAASALTSLLYSGEFFDKSINQQYLRASWYDATTGRFNRLDPFAGNMHDPQSLHKYAYVHGDPVNAWDPTGLRSLTELVGAVGAMVTKHAIKAYVISTVVSYSVGKIIEAAISLAVAGDFRHFQWYSHWDLLNLVPGAAVLKLAKLFPLLVASKYLKYVDGKWIGEWFDEAAGIVGKPSLAVKKTFESTFGIVDINDIKLLGGGKNSGIRHILDRHFVQYWNGYIGKNAVGESAQTFWPIGTSLDTLVQYAKEAMTKYTGPKTGGQVVELASGIKAYILVVAGEVKTFYPLSGPGVIDWKDLQRGLKEVI